MITEALVEKVAKARWDRNRAYLRDCWVVDAGQSLTWEQLDDGQREARRVSVREDLLLAAPELLAQGMEKAAEIGKKYSVALRNGGCATEARIADAICDEIRASAKHTREGKG